MQTGVSRHLVQKYLVFRTIQQTQVQMGCRLWLPPPGSQVLDPPVFISLAAVL